MGGFVDEAALSTFEGWVAYQAADVSTPEKLAQWRQIYDDVRRETNAMPLVGEMQIKPMAGEHRYAVALEDGGKLWLALWVRCSPKREVFVLVPRRDRRWNPHTSYHRDGTRHMKSYDRKVLSPQKRQPTDNLRGVEDLGTIAGYGPKSVGAICDPALFTEIVKVQPGVLGPRDGAVSVWLLEPNHALPSAPFGNVISQHVFTDVVPWIVITIGSFDAGSGT